MTDKPIAAAKPRRTVRKGAPPTPAETLGALTGTVEAEAPAPTPTDGVAAPVAKPKAATAKAAAAKAAKLEAKPASPKSTTPAKPKKPVSERTKPLNFRVTNEFRKAFKQAAANEDCKKVELLERMFDAWQATKKAAKAN